MRLCVVATCFVAFLVTGCDIDPLGEKADARKREADKRAEQERVRAETASQREAMLQYATGKKKNIQERMAEASKEEAALRADFSKLTAEVSRIMSEKDSAGNERKYEAKVFRVLRNADVNALASKYLASDFSAVVATYIERVREAREAEAQYAAAKREVDELYTANVEESKKWAAMTKQQRENEIKRLQLDVSQLELRRENLLKKRRDTTKNSIIGGQRLMIERFEKRDVQQAQLKDIDDQLFAKRIQLDRLRSPSEQGFLASRTTEESQRRQDSAQYSRQSAMHDIDRRLKPKRSVTDVVSEFEDATIGKLTKALSGKVSSLEEDIKALKGKLAAAEDAILQIPVSDISDLRRIKSQLDR